MVATSHYGPRLRALVGLLGSAFPLRFSKSQALLAQLLGVEISRGAIAEIRQRLSAALEPSTMFLQGLSRSAAAAVELLGTAFSGLVVSAAPAWFCRTCRGSSVQLQHTAVALAAQLILGSEAGEAVPLGHQHAADVLGSLA